MGKYGINNLPIYQEEMAKSWQDKISFLDHVWLDEPILDVGCSDGAIMEHLREKVSYSYIIGYDNNENMIYDAQRRGINRSLFTTNWQEVLNKLRDLRYLGAVLFSSVLHEMSFEDLTKILRDTREFKPDHIIIRDMFCPKLPDSLGANILTPIQAHPMHERWRAVKGCGVQTPKEVVQFLLTYRFTANYERELTENYFGTPWNELAIILPVLGYKKVLDEEYILPFLKAQIEEDFKFTPWPTHRKQIWRYEK